MAPHTQPHTTSCTKSLNCGPFSHLSTAPRFNCTGNPGFHQQLWPILYCPFFRLDKGKLTHTFAGQKKKGALTLSWDDFIHCVKIHPPTTNPPAGVRVGVRAGAAAAGTQGGWDRVLGSKRIPALLLCVSALLVGPNFNAHTHTHGRTFSGNSTGSNNNNKTPPTTRDTHIHTHSPCCMFGKWRLKFNVKPNTLTCADSVALCG